MNTALLPLLSQRFAAHPERHPGVDWAEVETRLQAAPAEKLRSLTEMENTGGEPDVIAHPDLIPEGDAFIFVDCAPESPTGRRSLCFDDAALNARKENKPKGSALGMAAAMGVSLLSEDQYRALQTLGAFDRKTSSWIATSAAIRDLGGALFCDRRYDTVFVYHNGAESYYAARGFRAWITV